MNETLPRRRFLATAGATVTAVSGCLGGSNSGVSADTTPTKQLETPVQGDPEAAVTVAVFKDYACPHCQEYTASTYPELKAEFLDAGDIRYEFHDFPIPVDPETSWQAACAARTVQEMAGIDSFWQYQKALFENQSSLGGETYAAVAGDLEVDSELVRQGAEDRQYEPTVSADRQTGIDLGVEGTPAVLVDGVLLDSWDVDTVVPAIRDAL